MVSRVTSALAAAIKSKAAVAVVTTVVAVGAVGGGTAAAAASGAFGQQVKAKVESCKDALANGVHGIGECVSDFAQQHGVQQRQQHSQGQSTSHGQSGTTHGQSGTTHGQSGTTHGQSGQHGGPPTATPGAGNGHGK